MRDLPTGIDRVDGYCVEPILNEVIDEMLGQLPKLEPPTESPVEV